MRLTSAAPCADRATQARTTPLDRVLRAGSKCGHKGTRLDALFWRRLVISVALGSAAAALVPVLGWKLGENPVDFLWTQFAVRDWIAGRDVYARAPHANLIPYPFTAAVLGWPLAWLPMTLAASIFTGAGIAVLAFGLTREGTWWRLLAIGSSSCFLAIKAVQWSPWLTAALIYPSLAFVWTAKPNFAMLGLARKPSRAAIVAGLGIVAASLLLLPGWPGRWLGQLGPYNGFVPALGSRAPGRVSFPAPWLLAALVRWRRPQARLLALLSVMPQHVYFYDQLALYVLPKTFRQMLVLVASGWAGLWLAQTVGFRFGGPILVGFLYLPALVIVLGRDNLSGSAPASPRAGCPSGASDA